MTADKLPPCPLCGDVPDVVSRAHLVYAHRRNGCALHGGCFTPDDWRNLAAPAEEVERLKGVAELKHNLADVRGETNDRLRAALNTATRAHAAEGEIPTLTEDEWETAPEIIAALRETGAANERIIDRLRSRLDTATRALREIADERTHWTELKDIAAAALKRIEEGKNG